jgi:KTSC domain-containing protein
MSELNEQAVKTMLAVTREKVESSHIVSIGWSANKFMTVEFRGGAVWAYYPVTDIAYNEFKDSDSKGQWFDLNIKKNTTISTFKLKDK